MHRGCCSNTTLRIVCRINPISWKPRFQAGCEPQFRSPFLWKQSLEPVIKTKVWTWWTGQVVLKVFKLSFSQAEQFSWAHWSQVDTEDWEITQNATQLHKTALTLLKHVQVASMGCDLVLNGGCRSDISASCADQNCDARWSCSFNEHRQLFWLCVALALTSGNSTAFNRGILSDRSQQWRVSGQIKGKPESLGRDISVHATTFKTATWIPFSSVHQFNTQQKTHQFFSIVVSLPSHTRFLGWKLPGSYFPKLYLTL